VFDPSSIRVTGSLAGHQHSLWANLMAQGYTPLSSRNLLYLTAHLSRWLDEKGLRPIDLSEDRIEEFIARRREVGYTHHLTRCALRPILEHLRGTGVVPMWEGAASEPTPLDQLLHGYERYLVQERALVSTTVREYRDAARKFLSQRGECGLAAIGRMTAADVSSYIVGESRRWCIGTAKHAVTALRSLLRYLLLRGVIGVDLACAVPAVAGYRLSGLPKSLSDSEVERLLEGCDQNTFIGLRDLAVVLLMSRLGLRACEVARLNLDDIQWARAEMVVRGKGGREDTLPLPRDVGKAMVRYIRRVRPSTICRAVFVTMTAPHRKLTSPGIQGIVKRAGRRIGLGGLGSHRLRHTAASRMLGRGASLPEIAQVLRHRSLATTAIYAKVDRDALRPLCRPWLGGRP
jgi:site-specific recombinase XerD